MSREHFLSSFQSPLVLYSEKLTTTERVHIIQTRQMFLPLPGGEGRGEEQTISSIARGSSRAVPQMRSRFFVTAWGDGHASVFTSLPLFNQDAQHWNVAAGVGAAPDNSHQQFLNIMTTLQN